MFDIQGFLIRLIQGFTTIRLQSIFVSRKTDLANNLHILCWPCIFGSFSLNISFSAPLISKCSTLTSLSESSLSATFQFQQLAVIFHFSKSQLPNLVHYCFCFCFFLHFLLHSVVMFESVSFILHCGPQKENNIWDVWRFTLTLMPSKVKLFSRESKGGRGIHELHEWMSWRVNMVSFCKHFRVVYTSTKLYHLQEWKTSDFFLLHCTFLAVFLFFYRGWV